MTATTVGDFEYTLLGIADYTKELRLLCKEKLAELKKGLILPSIN